MVMSQNSLMIVQVVCHEVERFKIAEKNWYMFSFFFPHEFDKFLIVLLTETSVVESC